MKKRKLKVKGRDGGGSRSLSLKMPPSVLKASVTPCRSGLSSLKPAVSESVVTVDTSDSKVGGRVVRIPFVYGNVSVPTSAPSQFSDERETRWYEWTVYVRGLQHEDLSYAIQRVVFHLHQDFPNPIRVVEKPPFEVTEVGWGDFPIEIAVYLHSARSLELMEELMNAHDFDDGFSGEVPKSFAEDISGATFGCLRSGNEDASHLSILACERERQLEGRSSKPAPLRAYLPLSSPPATFGELAALPTAEGISAMQRRSRQADSSQASFYGGSAAARRRKKKSKRRGFDEDESSSMSMFMSMSAFNDNADDSMLQMSLMGDATNDMLAEGVEVDDDEDDDAEEEDEYLPVSKKTSILKRRKEEKKMALKMERELVKRKRERFSKKRTTLGTGIRHKKRKSSKRSSKKKRSRKRKRKAKSDYLSDSSADDSEFVNDSDDEFAAPFGIANAFNMDMTGVDHSHKDFVLARDMAALKQLGINEITSGTGQNDSDLGASDLLPDVSSLISGSLFGLSAATPTANGRFGGSEVVAQSNRVSMSHYLTLSANKADGILGDSNIAAEHLYGEGADEQLVAAARSQMKLRSGNEEAFVIEFYNEIVVIEPKKIVFDRLTAGPRRMLPTHRFQQLWIDSVTKMAMKEQLLMQRILKSEEAVLRKMGPLLKEYIAAFGETPGFSKELLAKIPLLPIINTEMPFSAPGAEAEDIYSVKGKPPKKRKKTGATLSSAK